MSDVYDHRFTETGVCAECGCTRYEALQSVIYCPESADTPVIVEECTVSDG